MADQGVSAAQPIPSFLIECLVFNCPNSILGSSSYKMNVRNVIVTAFQATKDFEFCEKWIEVSGLKWLFRPDQPWTYQQVNSFLQAAWTYAEFDSE